MTPRAPWPDAMARTIDRLAFASRPSDEILKLFALAPR
jgi:hypothetical protein